MSTQRAYLSGADYRLLPAPATEKVPDLGAEAGERAKAECEMHLSPRLHTEVVPLLRLLTALSAPARLGLAVCLNAATVVHGNPARAERVLVILKDHEGAGGVFRRCSTEHMTRTQASRSSGEDGHAGA